jgi:hypothetical protein
MSYSIEKYAEFARTTAIYHKALTGEPEELMYLALGLVSEVSELASEVSEVEPEDRAQYNWAELGDVGWYLIRLADATGNMPVVERVLGGQDVETPTYRFLFDARTNLVLEAGYLCGLVKKVYRDGRSPSLLDKVRSQIDTVSRQFKSTAQCLGAQRRRTVLECLADNQEKLASRKARGKLGGSGSHR